MSKKKKKFKTLDSLNNIETLINEASEAIKKPSRTIVDSSIPDVLAGAAGASIGGAASFAALWALGTSTASMFSLSAPGIMGGLAAAGGAIGGGAAVGVVVLAAPVALCAGAGVGISSHIRNKKLIQSKERLYQEALKKHDAVINELQNKEQLSDERIKYLISLNILLEKAIDDLRDDLEEA